MFQTVKNCYVISIEETNICCEAVAERAICDLSKCKISDTFSK